MIEISVGNGDCHLIFDGGIGTATGHPVLSVGFVELGRSAFKVVGCAPADGDPDRNAALLILGQYGGTVVRYVPPDHGENVTY